MSGSLLQLVTAMAHPMMGFQGQLEEDPEQVVTASLILKILQRAECPEAGLAGMGILVAPRGLHVSSGRGIILLATFLNVVFKSL